MPAARGSSAQGRHVGYCDLTQGSVGAQAGAQTFSELLVFANKGARALQGEPRHVYRRCLGRRAEDGRHYRRILHRRRGGGESPVGGVIRRPPSAGSSSPMSRSERRSRRLLSLDATKVLNGPTARNMRQGLIFSIPLLEKTTFHRIWWSAPSSSKASRREDAG